MKIVFATNNENKTREIKNILGDSFTLLSLQDYNITEDIPENEDTLEGNALHKARTVYNMIHTNVFADDTGLEIDILDGLPGVHSARFAGENKDSAANIRKVLTMMGDTENRKARFRTIIALILKGKEYIFEGVVNGRIITKERGNDGFGYDPVFIPDGQNITFAEMSLDEKNRISHRAIAFEKLKTFLLRYQNNKKRV
ncbi:MAG TPA: RdgB/HAM1 family non-canonical purine NTP pyrophosphatase [Bacteroidales bacterium]|nr:RdgB/HAM1 family non-canonical purine NTP pyrophosphatase [Bacteroidales bacterium]HPI69093.1 RdgB/HAM1 family non-canonical purine NTP pyrophosphatase [Bacteroidales bacterium]